MGTFPRLANAKPGETVIFAWIVFKSRAHRDRVNRKVMKDPRIAKMDPKSMPVDAKRMSLRWVYDHSVVGLSSQLLAFSYEPKQKLRADG